MTAAVFKLTTAASTNLTKLKDGPANLKGFAFVNVAAAAIYVKFYWYLPTGAVPAPVVGTTIPDLTIKVPLAADATGSIKESFPDGMSKAGNLWMAVTTGAADGDSGAVAAGDGILSVMYE